MTQSSFRPLEKADEIRILVLHTSAENAAPLSGSLIHTTLLESDRDSNDNYRALSYVWGNTASTSSIRIDGIDVGITDNLAEALIQLRNACPGAPQRIWADALCINQSDIAEKNRQVPLMGNIYSLASVTTIYIGPSSPGIATIFKAIDESQPKFVTVNTTGKSKAELAIALRQMMLNKPTFHVKAGSEPSDAAIDELLQRPWFTRVWVTQELLLSRWVEVRCGALQASWKDFCALLIPVLDRRKGRDSTALQQMYSLSLGGAGLSIGKGMFIWEGHKAKQQKQSLSQILRMRQGCRASDPRDMIFGYMGLHKDREEVAKFFAVDYEMPLRQLLISTARYIYHQDGLEVLLRCVKRPPTSNWLNLPSWVPDWGIHEWSQVASVGCEVMSNTTSTMSADEILIGGVEKTVNYWPHQDPKFIRHLSPILPRPQDVPQYIVNFLERAARMVRSVDDDIAKRKFLEEENVCFWRDLNMGLSDPHDPNTVRLFPDSFWDPAAEVEGDYPQRSKKSVKQEKSPCKRVVATRAYQTLSFFMEYAGSRTLSASGFEDAFKWDLYDGQKIRLALSTAGCVLAVPAYIEMGDVFMRMDRSSSMNQKLHSEKDVFGGLLRPLAKDTGDSRTKAYRWLCFGGAPLCREYDEEDSSIGRFDICSMRRLHPTEADNDGLKWCDAESRLTHGEFEHIELY